ncbi:hypothetical protein C0Q71_27615 [Klebsiella pneumoniae]|nr:hypothetical protein [Klebsiella pneumoniae]
MLCHGTVCVVGKIRDLILQLSKSSIYSTKPVKNSLDELDGCHALIIGTCTYATTGKPILWCGDLSYIVLRRYKLDQDL